MENDIVVKLLCGDCMELMNDLPAGSVDMVLCDLPYGVLNKKNPGAKWDVCLPLDKLWERYERVCKPDGAIVLFASGMFTATLMMSNPKCWRYNLVWKKGERVTGYLNANKMPMRNHEDIVVFYQKQPVYHPQMVYSGLHKVNHQRGKGISSNNCYGFYKNLPVRESVFKYPKSVLNIQPEHKNFYHPSEKPVKLLSWLIETYTNKGDTVLDNCMGSGSCAVAAMETERNFIGMEIDKAFYDIADKRVKMAHKKQLRMQEVARYEEGV